jgi:membrane-bound ClpP family serine protease
MSAFNRLAPGRRTCRCGLAALLVLLPLAAARADGPAAEGQCVSVRSPLTSEEVHRIQTVSTWVLDHTQDRTAVKLVYDFNPGKGSASSSEFGPCADLAEYLLSLRDVTTIAFVHGEVSRHTVLPVLACRELAMSKDGRLGPIVDEQDPPLTETKLQAYRDVIRGRNLCPAIVLKLADRDMEVLQGLRGGAVWYIDARREQEEKKAGVVVPNPPHVILGRGKASYSAADAQTFGLCARTLETRQEVVREYGLPRTSLREDALLGQDPVAWQVAVTGPVTPGVAESLKRRIRRAVGSADRHANLVVLQLQCSGGDPSSAEDLAQWLHELKDDRNELPVKTVALLCGPSNDTGLIVALGCSEIAMRHDATAGDLSVLAGGEQAAPADEAQDGLFLKQVRTVAEDQGYPPALIRAMAYPNLAVYAVDSARGPRRSWIITEAELTADQKKPEPQWKNPRRIQSVGPADKPLVLDAGRAVEVRLARRVVDGLPDLYAEYGIKPDQVRSSGNDWLDDVAYVLRLPAMSIFLIMLGVTCLVLELKMPGVGLPGVVAAVCFVLFFWSHAHDASFTLLAILLFVLGLVLVGVEVFVLPGTAVLGISGIVLVLASLTLVTIDRWPQTTHEWFSLGQTVVMFALSLGGAVITAMVVAWYLPHIPYMNRLVLKPAADGLPEDALEDQPATAARPDYGALLGAIGVAATPLRPAGKVKFGDDFVDVVAEGSYVQPGARVQVIEVEGYRVVVKEV